MKTKIIKKIIIINLTVGLIEWMYDFLSI
jgi:hypothetical protein